MRFAIDILDEAGNNRIYVGVPLGIDEGKLRIQLKDREARFDVARITDWCQIDRGCSEGRGELLG